jgi:hypothetical protein
MPAIESPYIVKAWHFAHVRAQPFIPAPGDDNIVSSVFPNNSYPAFCWTRGEVVTDQGFTNEVWISLALKSGGIGYVSAIYLDGGDLADLPGDAECRG